VALAQESFLLFLQTRPLHGLNELRPCRAQLSRVELAGVDIELPSSFPVADCLELLTRLSGFAPAN